MKEIIKQLLCPILGTMYLVGGYEYGHQWRYVEGKNEIICRKCHKKIFFLIYKRGDKAGQELYDFSTPKEELE